MTIVVFLASLLGAMALGMPIAFALLVCGLGLMLHMGNFDAQIMAQNLVSGADSFVLLAVPFFMLAGEFMNAGGLSRRIVGLCMALVGHVQGGLGYVAIIAALLLASISGSAAADTAALAALLIPMMRDAAYDLPRSTGLIAAGGIIAPVIPPSIGFVVFGVAGGVSINKLFMAGIMPGLMMGIALVLTWWWVTRGTQVRVQPRATLTQIFATAVDGVWALVMPIIIIGGLKFGVFTPTEAAVMAAMYALMVGTFVYRELTLVRIYECLLSAAKISAVVMFLVAAASVSAWLITVADLPGEIVGLVQPLMESPTLLLLALMLLVVLVGTAMDFIPTILILTPVLMPIVKQAGIDPIYFGVLFVMNNAIGLITPPVGTVLNVVCGVAKIRLDEVIPGVAPFLWAQLAVLFLLVLMPAMVLVPMRWFL
jgi:tripartite ATP-independent transporter DctM subunit